MRRIFLQCPILVFIITSSIFTSANVSVGIESGNSQDRDISRFYTNPAIAPVLGGCSIFPDNNFWNTPIDTLPVHSSSTAWINSIGATEEFHMDFGSGTWDGGPIGIPYNVISGASTTKYNVSFYYPDESDVGPYPIPANPNREWGSDHHILTIDTDTCILYELYDASKSGSQWYGGSGAIWDLNSNALRPDTWTSADAAGLPILPGLVRYDEILSGEINHAIRFTTNCTANYYIWPARHVAESGSCANPVPFGARFRLKEGYNISGFSPQMQVILQAMKTYGIVLADNGSPWYISGAPDPGWNNDMLHTLDVLIGNNFEAVDTSSLMLDPNTAETPYNSPPRVTSIVRTNTNPTSFNSVNFVVTFSESVTGVDISDFSLTTSGISGASITGVSGTDTTYTVSVNTGTGNGTIRLDVPVTANINDVDSNPLGRLPFSLGHVYTIDKNFRSINVLIAGVNKGQYNLLLGNNQRESYTAVNAGPVKVSSNVSTSIIASERVAYTPNGGTTWTSFDEMMGLPSNQLTDTYHFPYYNNVEMNTQLRIGNVGTSSTNVTVTIGGVVQGVYPVAPSQSIRLAYNLNSGPVQVKSSGGIPIIASMRFAYIESTDPLVVPAFTEMMGLPGNQLSSTYIFPHYNNLEMNTQLRFGNVGTSSTNVTVTIGGVVRGVYPVAPKQSLRLTYNLNSGPVKVQSSGGVPIIASMRFARIQSESPLIISYFSEMLGLPQASLSTNYWFPVYDNVTHNMQLRFGNMGTSNTTVKVRIGGIERGSYVVLPNQSQRLFYSLNNGPVQVESSGGIPIIASIRFAYIESESPLVIGAFSEMLGLPAAQLSSTYLFPWYNNDELDSQIRFAIP